MAVKQGWGSGGLEIDLLVLVLDHFRHRLVLHAGRVPLVIVVHLPTLLRVSSGAWSTHRWRSIDPWKKIGNWHVKKHVLGRDSEFTMRPRPRNRSNDRNSRGEISLRFEIRLESNREILFRDWETICTSTRWSRIYVCFFRIANYNLRCFSLRIDECWSVVYRNFMKFSR